MGEEDQFATNVWGSASSRGNSSSEWLRWLKPFWTLNYDCDDIRPKAVTSICNYVFVFMSIYLLNTPRLTLIAGLKALAAPLALFGQALWDIIVRLRLMSKV